MQLSDFHDPRTAFAKGKHYTLQPMTVSKEQIIEFASEYDPAFFHVDEDAAKSSLIGSLIASGFHTCAIAMRMICDSYLLETTSQGAPEVEEVTWHHPVFPGDTLSGRTSVLEARQSKSKPNLWIATLNHEINNQNDQKVLSMRVIALFAIPDSPQ